MTLIRYRIKSDKRSKCRKSKDYKAFENQVKNLNNFIDKKNLFGANPNDLITLNDQLNVVLGKTESSFYDYFFDYKKYYKIIDNKLGKPLNLKCCPYCNRNFVTYIPNEDKRFIGPTYDHFFNKERFKYITLSFYNLIPSCYICNSNLKLNKEFKIDTHINPFVEGFGADCVFDFELSTKNYTMSKEISFVPRLRIEDFVSLGQKTKIEGNLLAFKLNEIYENHNDSVEEIYKKFDKASPFYIGSISKILDILGTSEEEFYRFNFRNYFNEIDFNKRPLAKLDKNIYEKFKSISGTE